MSQKSIVNGKRSSLQWTEPMDQILLNALLHQVNKGNRVNGQFTSIAFEEAVQEVCTKTQMDAIDKDKVKNRIKTLKKSFAEAYEFSKGLDEIEWNPTTKLFEADNEVWNDLIKSNANAIQWKTKPISHYDKLKEIWGKDENAETKVPKWSAPIKIKGEIMIDNNTMESLDFTSSYDSSHPHQQRGGTIGMQFPCGNPSKAQVGSTTKKQKMEDALLVEMNGIKNVMERVVDVLAIGNSIIERSRPRVYSESEVYAELEHLKLDDGVRLEAYEFLTANQVLVRNMFGLPLHIRRNWLIRKLYGAH